MVHHTYATEPPVIRGGLDTATVFASQGQALAFLVVYRLSIKGLHVE